MILLSKTPCKMSLCVMVMKDLLLMMRVLHPKKHSVVDTQDILLMVGPYGDWIKHDLEERTVLVSECDAVRLISADKHELLSRVADSLVDVFKIGSTAPGALLNGCILCWPGMLCICLRAVGTAQHGLLP